MSLGPEREKAREEAHELLGTLEGELKGKKFFGGKTVGFVDIVASFVGHWVGALQEAAGVDVLTEDKLPVLCKWAEEFRNCPVVKENLPQRDKMVAFFKGQREMITSFYKNKAWVLGRGLLGDFVFVFWLFGCNIADSSGMLGVYGISIVMVRDNEKTME